MPPKHLWLKSLTAQSHCIIFVLLKESVIRSAMSSPCWSLPHLLSFSLPQHAALPGQRDFLQEDTVHQNHFRKNLNPKLPSRKATLKNRSHTSSTRVAETCAQTPPKEMELLRNTLYLFERKSGLSKYMYNIFKSRTSRFR